MFSTADGRRATLAFRHVCGVVGHLQVEVPIGRERATASARWGLHLGHPLRHQIRVYPPDGTWRAS
ncbi:hypothetical protein [Nocardia anaemiae]|uniref:hypothetical protein n=1 Tax=Nocardia anaemiae TaxID=263910 RepID=UPI0007A44803|nr:hypothetical protein [Nocardia anaemiae]